MTTPTLQLTTSAANLRRLALIRLILIIALLMSLGYSQFATGSDLILPTNLTIMAMFALINVLTFWRLQQPWPVTDPEYFGQLLLDIVGVSVILYTSGGATNPFISYYLVPITISAALLPWRYTWMIAALSLAAYTLLLFFYQPLPALLPDHSQHSGHDMVMDNRGVNLHILGMWVTFALSTALITYFVVKMAHALRAQQLQQANSREDELRDEQILAVATLAAGTAHELGTPLSTMTVLLDEMTASDITDKPLQDDLQCLKTQLERCRKILANLVNTAEIRSHDEKQTVYLKAYIATLVDHWQLMRPQTDLRVTVDPVIRQQRLRVDPTLEQAISNLLNNAAEASRNGVDLNLSIERQQAVIVVRDDGDGIPLEVADRIGKPFVTTKGKGLGLGLFLSHATIDRYGGSIKLYNHPEGGTVAELRLPLTAETE